MKKLYQPYYSRRGRPTKEEQAERLRQEQKRLRGSGFLEIPHDGDNRSSSIESAKSAPPELVVTESEESEDEVGLDEESEATDIENKVDVAMADPSQQQGQQMPDIQQMLAQLLVNQQALQNEFQQQQQTLQNEFRGLANAQRETDRRLNDVIAGGAVGPGGGAPPVPPAPAAVLPVPPVATVNVQPQLHPLRRFRMTDGAKDFLGWRMDWDRHAKYVNSNFGSGAASRLRYDLEQALDYDVKRWMASQARLQATAVQEDAEALIKALEEHLFETTTPGYVLREMFQKKQSSTETVDDLHFNNKTSLDYSLRGRDRDSMIDLILTQTLIMQVQNRKLVEILIDNQDKPYEHVLKKARDWELLHK